MRRSLSVLKMCLTLSCSSVIFAAAAWSQQTAPKPAPPVDPIGLPPPLSEDLSLIEHWLDTLSDQAVLEGSLTPGLGDQPDATPVRPTEPAEPDWDFIDRLELETRLRNEGLLRKRTVVMRQWMQRTRSLLPATSGSLHSDQAPQANANESHPPGRFQL